MVTKIVFWHLFLLCQYLVSLDMMINKNSLFLFILMASFFAQSGFITDSKYIKSGELSANLD